MMRVGEIAVGRSGDKGDKLDLTLVALNADNYAWLERCLTTSVAQAAISRVMPGVVTRYEVPGLLALKFVIEGALPGGVYATLHAGLHWQKAAIWVLLDLEIDG
ncbi:MAG: hypothetical protein VW907_03305 [Opitutae bacterium]|jgi:hypothetical protein